MQVDREILPLTAEGLEHEAVFTEVLALAAKKGLTFREWLNGYRLDGPGVIRHFDELLAAHTAIRKM